MSNESDSNTDSTMDPSSQSHQTDRLDLSELFQSLDRFDANELNIFFQKCFQSLTDGQDASINGQALKKLLLVIFGPQEDSVLDEMTKYALEAFSTDEQLNKEQFDQLCNKWLKVCLCPKYALIVVDVQNDFISGSLQVGVGSAQQSAQKIIPIIKQLIETIKFDLVVFTKDWHPPNHISFVTNVSKRPLENNTKELNAIKPFDKVVFKLSEDRKVSQTLYPEHCVQNTWGSEIHQDLLALASKATIILKGEDSEVDSYSAFFDNNHQKCTSLQSTLVQNHINTLIICGLATDICVAETAQDALNLGYGTIIMDAACAGLDVDAIKQAYDRLIKQGLLKCEHLQDVVEIVQTNKRPVPLALYHVKRFAQQQKNQ